jgi:hypothetical protein
MDSFSEITRADERRRVLEILQRGQISAAEADEVMAALEGRSATQAPPPPSRSRFSREESTSVPGLAAVVGGLARALARVIAGLALALGRVIGVVGRLWGRAGAP